MIGTSSYVGKLTDDSETVSYNIEIQNQNNIYQSNLSVYATESKFWTNTRIE